MISLSCFHFIFNFLCWKNFAKSPHCPDWPRAFHWNFILEMISPEELRKKLSTSQFFKDIQSKTKTDILVCNGGILFGVSDELETVVSLSLNNRQTLSTICGIPLHGITSMSFSVSGSLLMWSSTGVSLIPFPVRPGSNPVTIQERLGAEYILNVKWFGEKILVLKSNNEILIYEDPKRRPVIMPNLTVRDKLTDVIGLAEQEFLTVSSNGFVRINEDIVCNVELEGDIRLQQIQDRIRQNPLQIFILPAKKPITDKIFRIFLLPTFSEGSI
ncbi:unnamed protein product [Oikopleura dioica]|uniref:CNH domain-containing protein n=2 Tax=Oikopleura dioica TaxID=34765 RepID=E4Z112_OIKDI|nr:unnamed protein product [Oikopleura dioica]